MRLTSWNLLHGMAISRASGAPTFLDAIQAMDVDVIALQEVDHFLPRTQSRSQVRDIAESIGARDWVFAPTVFGTPGESWRKLRGGEPELISQNTPHSDLIFESYGIGIVSRIPVKSFRRLHLGNSPLGMPLLVAGDETGKGRPRFIYVKDEPRVAVAATLENGYTIINAHLSFVPGFNAAQLVKIKRWAAGIESETSTSAIIVGDFNLPSRKMVAGKGWSSVVDAKTYPSWNPKVQFDHILINKKNSLSTQPLTFAPTGISDHLPIGIEVL